MLNWWANRREKERKYWIYNIYTYMNMNEVFAPFTEHTQKSFYRFHFSNAFWYVVFILSEELLFESLALTLTSIFSVLFFMFSLIFGHMHSSSLNILRNLSVPHSFWFAKKKNSWKFWDKQVKTKSTNSDNENHRNKEFCCCFCFSRSDSDHIKYKARLILLFFAYTIISL